MSKMNELSMTIEELRSAATAILAVADSLTEMFSTPESDAPPEAPPLTLEDVRGVLADRSRLGHTAAIRELLLKYGASKLSEIDPTHYEGLLREAEVLT